MTMAVHPIIQEIFSDFGMATSKSDVEREFDEAMADRENPKHPMFRCHNCWKCGSGEKPCTQGNPSQCEYPHARND